VNIAGKLLALVVGSAIGLAPAAAGPRQANYVGPSFVQNVNMRHSDHLLGAPLLLALLGVAAVTVGTIAIVNHDNGRSPS
jgi:hypothetical protein